MSCWTPAKLEWASLTRIGFLELFSLKLLLVALGVLLMFLFCLLDEDVVGIAVANISTSENV